MKTQPGLTAAILVVALLAACSEPAPSTYQGYVEGEFVRVASPIAGTLERLSVERGSTVKAGDPLFALEQESEAAARREAEERVRVAKARLANLEKGKRPEELAAIDAQYREAQAALEFSKANFQRQQKLVADGFVSPNAVDSARSAFERDQARVAELTAQRRIGRLPARTDEIRAARADVEAAEAALAQAAWRLEQKAVAAPVAGSVQDRLYLPGEHVPAGNPVVSILPPENLKLRFFVPEPDLAQLKIGQPVTATCDGCGDAIPATVSFISTQAEFTPPIIYSRERRQKLVFLVEAKVAAERATRLHPGQPVDVHPR